MGVVHLAHASDEGGEGPDYGHEAGEDDGLAAVSVVEVLSLREVALLEDLRVRVAEQPASEEMPYGVVAGVAEEGGREDDEHQQMYVQWRAGQGCDGSGHEEQ